MPGYKNIVVVGGSAGSFPVVCKLLKNLSKRDFVPPVFLALHRLRSVRKGFGDTLRSRTGMNVIEPEDKTLIQPNTVYLAPANYHMVLETRTMIALSQDAPLNFSRPAIDLTMVSASHHYRERVTGIMLSGANRDGVRGMYRVHLNGGKTIIQDPELCKMPTMTQSCVELFSPTGIIPPEDIHRYVPEELDQFTLDSHAH